MDIEEMMIDFILHEANDKQRVWVECEVEDWTSYNRPESQGGSWILAQKMKIIRELTEMEVYEILRDAA